MIWTHIHGLLSCSVLSLTTRELFLCCCFLVGDLNYNRDTLETAILFLTESLSSVQTLWRMSSVRTLWGPLFGLYEECSLIGLYGECPLFGFYGECPLFGLYGECPRTIWGNDH